ncbi:Tyrosine recombinase XerC [bioreactor metagenome]|uniref:Tyrosine recombinase XerC n=1 Tax=bioreactor metagenome TaxID=1076179 RepID=A0A644VSG5_9ZZZZ
MVCLEGDTAMPRRGENIYKRKDGRWEARILNNSGSYRYVYARTYKEVREKKKALHADLDKKEPARAGAACSTAELFERWLYTEPLGSVKASTYESYHRCVTGYIIPFFAQQHAASLSEDMAARFVKHICASSTISDAYKRKVLAVFKTALRHILRGSSEYARIMEAIRLPKAAPKSIEVFSLREQRQIEHTVHASWDNRTAGILICFYTGLRLGELCALKWSDVDLEAGIMKISRTVSRVKSFQESGSKTKLVLGTPKSHKSVRSIPLPGFLLDLMVALKAKAFSEENYILTNSDTPMEPRACQKLFKRILKQSEVKDRKFHTIRHTFATRALELGVDIKTLSEILGHSSVSITLNVYAHSLFEQKRLAMDKLNTLYLVHTEEAVIAVAGSVTPS